MSHDLIDLNLRLKVAEEEKSLATDNVDRLTKSIQHVNEIVEAGATREHTRICAAGLLKLLLKDFETARCRLKMVEMEIAIVNKLIEEHTFADKRQQRVMASGVRFESLLSFSEHELFHKLGFKELTPPITKQELAQLPPAVARKLIKDYSKQLAQHYIDQILGREGLVITDKMSNILKKLMKVVNA